MHFGTACDCQNPQNEHHSGKYFLFSLRAPGIVVQWSSVFGILNPWSPSSVAQLAARWRLAPSKQGRFLILLLARDGCCCCCIVAVDAFVAVVVVAAATVFLHLLQQLLILKSRAANPKPAFARPPKSWLENVVGRRCL